MNIDTIELEPKDIKNEQFFVQARPLIQYGPLTLSQLKELYINEVINDNTFIATNSCLSTFHKENIDNSYRVIPNERPLWSPIRSLHLVHAQLENTNTSYKKRNSENSDDSKTDDSKTNSTNSNVNFQLNINGASTMDINMNITNNNKKINKNNISRQELESLKFEIKLLEEKNKSLSKINRDLQKEITTLKVKYQSQFINLKNKMMKQVDEYKKQALESEINCVKNVENTDIISENEELKRKEKKLISEMSEMQLNILYYKTRYKSIQAKSDLETFNYDKYHSNITQLKEQVLQKQSIISHSHEIVNSLLKNTICDLIPYHNGTQLNEVEGNHNFFTKNVNKQVIRLDALKISELLAWHNYSKKFHLSMDLLAQYELTSRRSRSRMKTVVNMLGEKVKSLNIHNLTPSELIHLSRDLKQSFESISSGQHLKEYELSNQRREFMKHVKKPGHKTQLSPMLSPLTSENTLRKTTSHNGTGLYLDNINDHNYNLSFSSMASLSMMDIQVGNLSRNQSLHSLSPSLDGTESHLYKHRTKSNTIKGSGLKLLTDQDTIKSYLNTENNNNNNRIQRRNLKNSKRSISRSNSHRQVPTKQNGKYNHYSAFKPKKNNIQRRKHNKHSSISSNKSQSRSLYGYNDHHKQHRLRKDNHSNNSISALSGAGNGLTMRNIRESFDDEQDEHVSDDDDDDTSTVILKASPKVRKKERKITFDLDNDINHNHMMPLVNPEMQIDESREQDAPGSLSNDILSFFAM